MSKRQNKFHFEHQNEPYLQKLIKYFTKPSKIFHQIQRKDKLKIIAFGPKQNI